MNHSKQRGGKRSRGGRTQRPRWLPGLAWGWWMAYDDHRRFVLTSLLVRPERWTGSLPE